MTNQVHFNTNHFNLILLGQRNIDAPIIIDIEEGQFLISEDVEAVTPTLVFQKIMQEAPTGTNKKMKGKVSQQQIRAILTISENGSVEFTSNSLKKDIVRKIFDQIIPMLTEEEIQTEDPQTQAITPTTWDQPLEDSDRETLRSFGWTEQTLSTLTKYASAPLSAAASTPEELAALNLKESCEESGIFIPDDVSAEHPFTLFDSDDQEKLALLGDNKDLALFTDFHLKISTTSANVDELILEATEREQEDHRSFALFYDSTGKITRLQVDGQFFQPSQLTQGAQEALGLLALSAATLSPTSEAEAGTSPKKAKKKKLSNPPQADSPPKSEASGSSKKKSNEKKSNEKKSSSSDDTPISLGKPIPFVPVRPAQKMDNLLVKLSSDQKSSTSIRAAMAWMDDAIRSKIEKVVRVSKGDEGIALQEALGHLFLAGCGFEQFALSIEEGRVEEALAAYPMLLIDWHVELEQIITKYLRALNVVYPEKHSLGQLIEACNKHKQLTVTLNDVEGIDRALIWSRYPSNTLQDKKTAPEAVKWIRFCQHALKEPQKIEHQRLTKFVNYVLKTHHQTLALLIDLLELDKEEGQASIGLIMELFGSSDVEGAETAVIETRLQGALDTAYQKIQSGSKVIDSPLTKEINKLLINIQKYSSNLPEDQTDIKGCLLNLDYHLRRLRMTSPMGERNNLVHLQAWHTRNAMNIQWVIEELLRIQELLTTGTFNPGHNFKSYSDEKGKGKQLDEANYSIGSHYPVAFGQRDRRFGTYLTLLDRSRRAYIVEEGFQSADQMRHSRTGLDDFRKTTENILPALQKANGLMDEIIKIKASTS